MDIPISQQYAIGIDIGGTNTKFGLVNHRGDISYHGAILTHKHELVTDFIDELHQAIMPAVEDNGGIGVIRGIGIGARIAFGNERHLQKIDIRKMTGVSQIDRFVQVNAANAKDTA